MTETLQLRMAQAAMALLDTLDPEQRARVNYPSVDVEERELWFYTPTDHGGLRMQYMTSAQQRDVHRLLVTGLSARGYVTTATIMAMENILDATEGFTWPLREEDGVRIRDPLAYALSVFGDPSGSAPWGWRFGGHHVSLNYLVTPHGVRALPSFFGSDRAITPATGSNLMRPLAAEEDLGRELVHLLTAEQRQRATLSPVPPPDIVTSNRPVVGDGDRPRAFAEIWRGKSMNPNPAGFRQLVEYLGLEEQHLAQTEYTTTPRGLPYTEMTAGQQEAARVLLHQYIDRMPDEVAETEQARLQSTVGSLHFAWAGGIERGQPHYYRFQGDSLLVEYDNTQSQANHIHSIWRDPAQDFGRDILAEHYAQAHTH